MPSKTQKPESDLTVTEEVSEIVKESSEESEPSWYHYLIVLFIFACVAGIFYLAFSMYQMHESTQTPTTEDPFTYPHAYKVGNVTYNIHFHKPFDELAKLTYPLEVSKIDLLNSRELIFGFSYYNGSDNGQVTTAASMLQSFFAQVYFFSFEKEVNFVRINESDPCLNSTVQNKYLVFQPYSERSGIFYTPSNGCILVEAQSPEELVTVADYWLYNLIEAK
ncbi:MAG: hypothetical protein H6500_01045 [Candidatus Woesearchaeota archaeon]|nr:hypothetical protein [Nanoarchaeota archaeon]USN44418.1 MAG: hypothetical protein H6500_01045 [Candidatus Woesearchaeota archaeon]